MPALQAPANPASSATSMTTESTPVMIIGGGLAGLALALRLADRGIAVTILSKQQLDEGSTRYAQGGIAAVLTEEDSFQAHIDDTHRAGVQLCRKQAVEFVVKHAPRRFNGWSSAGSASACAKTPIKATTT